MAVNPETVVTTYFKRRVIAAGGWFQKLSDRFSRGIPDVVMCISRVVMVELKTDTGLGVGEETYKTLKMSGLQDHNVRAICNRDPYGACTITIKKDCTGARLWVPVRPDREGRGFEDYVCVANGMDEVIEWLTIRPT